MNCNELYRMILNEITAMIFVKNKSAFYDSKNVKDVIDHSIL